MPPQTRDRRRHVCIVITAGRCNVCGQPKPKEKRVPTVRPSMKCGHTANAVRDGKPVCVICSGIKPGADEIDPNPPDLTGRMMRCSCRREIPSNPQAAFFEHRGGVGPDGFYCGCRGWD